MSRVVVIGGGVVGACSAYYLVKAGCQVVVLDRMAFGAGCSHANCGYVCPSHVLPFAGPGAIWSTLRTLFQSNSPLKVRPGVVLRDPGWFLRFAMRCNQQDRLAAGDAIRALLASSRHLFDELIVSENIACEWEAKGLLFVFQTAAAMEHYAETDHLLSERFDTPARRIDSEQLAAFEPRLKPGLAGGWLYESDAHLRPDRLMAELRRVLVTCGVEILEHCEVTGFTTEHGRARAVRTVTEEIDAEHIVLATGAWSPRFATELGCRVPIQPGKGYSLTFAPVADAPRVPMILEEHRVAVTPFQSGFRIGSTMEFAGYDSSMNRDRLRLLTDGAAHYLRTPLPNTPVEEWWGWRPMTPDSLPIIGPSPAMANVWLAAGHNMLGLSMATGTGKLIAELVTENRPHLELLPYSPNRF